MDELKVDETQALFGRVTSEELIEALAESTKSLIQSIPVGQISPIYIYDIEGFVLPDPNLWMECDGGIITNKYSVLYNPQTPEDLTGEIDENKVTRVPNLINQYIRMSVNYGEDGQEGGSNTHSLSHNHGGVTGSSGYDNNAEGGDNDVNAVRGYHNHGIWKWRRRSPIHRW